MISQVIKDGYRVTILVGEWAHWNSAADSALFCGIVFYANNFKWAFRELI